MKKGLYSILLVVTVLLSGMDFARSMGQKDTLRLSPTILRERDRVRSSGLNYLTINAQGFKEFLNERDSSILIEIPAGSFIMGSNDDKDRKPVHEVYLDKYFIGKYEVTNSQYKKYCDATGYPYPEDAKYSGMTAYFINYPNYPVVNVSWNEAKAYCDWACLRLPTEAEWEKASRGTDGRNYPWGNSWDASKCIKNIYEKGNQNTSPVGSIPAGISPYGVYDMAGNVWEWCNDWYGEKYYQSSPCRNPTGPSSGSYRVLRGSSWLDIANNIGRFDYRGRGPQTECKNIFGFRITK